MLTARLIFFLLLTIISTIYALWRGGAPERIAAIIFICGYIATVAFQSPMKNRFHDLELGVFIVDGAVLVALVIVAIFANRYWTIWVAGFQIIQTLSHLPRLLVPDILPQAYGEMISFWGYPMVVILMAGTYRHQGRLKQKGTDVPWSNLTHQG